jgi:hypothetical protein
MMTTTALGVKRQFGLSNQASKRDSSCPLDLALYGAIGNLRNSMQQAKESAIG